MSESKLKNTIASNIIRLVNTTRRNKSISFLLIALLAALNILLFLKLFTFGSYFSLAISIFLLTVATAIFFRSPAYRQINAENIVEYINRLKPEFEESA